MDALLLLFLTVVVKVYLLFIMCALGVPVFQFEKDVQEGELKTSNGLCSI